MSLFPLSGSTIKGRVVASFPVAVTGTGGLRVSKSNGVWTIEPAFDELDTITPSYATNPTTRQLWIYDPVEDEYNVMTLAGLGEALYVATSTTSLAIGAGSKAFTTQAGKGFAIGSFVIATSDADPTDYMLGQVTSYSGTTLTVFVTAIGGTGTKADWTIRASASAGSAGKSSGFSYSWDDGTSAADPGSGNIRANHATLSSATAIYISETDADGAGIAAIIAAADNSTSSARAQVKIYNPVTPTSFAVYNITGANTDGGAWDTLSVAYVAHGGSFTDGDALRVEFIAAGDKGDTGATGADGVDPGILLTWDEDNADSDQGAGAIWASNDTLSSAGTLYVSKTNRAGNDISAFLAALDDADASVKGIITLTRSSDEDQCTFNLAGLTDATGYVKLAVSGHSGATGFTAADAISFQFSRSGDDGSGGMTMGKAIAAALVFG